MRGHATKPVSNRGMPRPRGAALWLVAAYGSVTLALMWAADLPAMLHVREITALVAGALLALAGVDASVDGCVVVVGDATTIVSDSCVPVAALAVAVSLAMVAGPRRPLWRIAAAATGVVFVLGANVLRIAAVAVLAHGRSPLLQPAHEVVFPVLLVAVAVGSWALTTRVGRREA